MNFNLSYSVKPYEEEEVDETKDEEDDQSDDGFQVNEADEDEDNMVNVMWLAVLMLDLWCVGYHYKIITKCEECEEKKMSQWVYNLFK